METRKEQQIIDTLCSLSGYGREDVLGRRGKPSVTLVRMAAYYLIRTHTDLSLSEIGRIFDRDHSTVVNGIYRAAKDKNIMRAYITGTQQVLGLKPSTPAKGITADEILARAAAMMEQA